MTDSMSLPAPVTLLGIPELDVTMCWEFAGERRLFVQTRDGQRVYCRECGVRAESAGRSTVHVRDVASAGKATRLVWRKRIWRCHDCRRTWRESIAEIPSRAVMTERSRLEAARLVGQDNLAVAAVARTFGVGWETIMRAVRELARTMFDEQGVYSIQRRPAVAIGVDEKVMNRAAPGRHTTYSTIIVNLATGKTLDIVKGRSKAVLRGWLAAQSQAWRDGVKIVSLDPYAGYRAALMDPRFGLHNAQLAKGPVPRREARQQGR